MGKQCPVCMPYSQKFGWRVNSHLSPLKKTKQQKKSNTESHKIRITLFHFSCSNQNEKHFKFVFFCAFLKNCCIWKELPTVSPKFSFLIKSLFDALKDETYQVKEITVWAISKNNQDLQWPFTLGKQRHAVWWIQKKNYWETRKFASRTSSSKGGTEMCSLYTEGCSAMSSQINEGLVLKMHNLIKRKNC